MIRVIEGGGQGERSSSEYGEVQESYEALSESATKREEIPLTRRDYIRDYFEAIRPDP